MTHKADIARVLAQYGATEAEPSPLDLTTAEQRFMRDEMARVAKAREDYERRQRGDSRDVTRADVGGYPSLNRRGKR